MGACIHATCLSKSCVSGCSPVPSCYRAPYLALLSSTLCLLFTRLLAAFEDESTPRAPGELQTEPGAGAQLPEGDEGYVGAPEGFWAEARGLNKREKEPKKEFFWRCSPARLLLPARARTPAAPDAHGG